MPLQQFRVGHAFATRFRLLGLCFRVAERERGVGGNAPFVFDNLSGAVGKILPVGTGHPTMLLIKLLTLYLN